MTTLSLCMIVLNEEAIIQRALESVHGLVNELLLVDTGSSDRTGDIARLFGATIYPYLWTDNFSAARNAGLQRVRSDWVLVLDADETINAQDHDRIRLLIDNPAASAYRLPRRTYQKDPNVPGLIPSHEDDYTESKPYPGWVETKIIRLFRLDPWVEFRGPIHEIVDPSIEERGGVIETADVPIHHFRVERPVELVRRRLRRYRACLEAAVEEETDDARLWYHLGLARFRDGEFADAYPAFKTALSLSPERAEPLVYLGKAALKIGQFLEARQTLEQALALGPAETEYLDISLELAKAWVSLDDINRAIEITADLVQRFPQSVRAWLQLAILYEGSGKPMSAQQALQEAAALHPESPKIQQKLKALEEKIYGE